LRQATKRHSELRQRRRAAGWVEILVWIPRGRVIEVKAAIEELVGKPPSVTRPAAPSRSEAMHDDLDPE
jgi:hypothetical protein